MSIMHIQCPYLNAVHTGNSRKGHADARASCDMNRKAAAKMLNAGMSQVQIKRFTACMEIPL